LIPLSLAEVIEMAIRTIDVPLVSNGYELSTAPNRLGWLTPSDPNAPMDDLREQYQQQGYLWLKGVLDRDAVLAFRQRFMNAYEEVAGEADRERKMLMEFVRTAAYEAFCLQPAIWQFYEKLLEGDVYLHKRKIVRYFNPGKDFSTPAHYDLIYLRGGTDTVCSSWIPIGDCPVEMGGLVYLEGSATLGKEMEIEFSQKNAQLSPEERISAYNRNMSEGGWVGKNLPEMADKFDARWLMADYEAGDMVVHSAYMIHAGTANFTNEMRLSTDIRYQRIRDEIDARWQNHWTLDDML
jgi:ectoine hydroxylase-related dioxygenase (phytanoyl-CoA dioxygenase family)